LLKDITAIVIIAVFIFVHSCIISPQYGNMQADSVDLLSDFEDHLVQASSGKRFQVYSF
jgi:hypothetical protein